MRRMVSTGLVAAACVIALSLAAPSAAQPHGPRPIGPRVGVGFYYGPYFYNPWFYSSVWWYPPWGYGYPYYYGAVGANIRIQVQPKSAEVYVDGHLAGIVDQFDGMFQNLVVEPGSHEIIVYQEGYKRIVQRLYLSVGSSYKIKGMLEELAAGEPSEPRPVPAPEPWPAQAQDPGAPARRASCGAAGECSACGDPAAHERRLPFRPGRHPGAACRRRDHHRR